MMGADVFTSQVLQRALELKEQGMSWSRISARLGVSDEGLRRRLVPGFATRRQQLIREARYARALGKSPDTPRHIPEAEALAVLRTVPTDTRRPIARLMGDPLPGRSALDKKRAEMSRRGGVGEVIHANIHNPQRLLHSGNSELALGAEAPYHRI
jgi:hypothetical protein